MASRIRPALRVAVAGADEGRLDRVDLAGPAQPALLAQHDVLRVLGAGRTERLLHDVRRAADQVASEPGVGQPA